MKIVPMAPGLEINDMTVESQLITLEHDLQPREAQAEDVVDMASVYPMEDIDREAPIDDKVMRVSALLVEYGRVDKANMRLALSTALKNLRLRGDLDQYDQSASGRQADALDAIAGTRHGYRPARLIYRLAYQTKWDRYWKTFGHDDKVKSRLLRRFLPGPEVRAEDISYWIVIRSCWHCMRPVNGIMQNTAHPDIPTDARPEDVIGDDWKCWEGLPQQRISQKGWGVVDTNASLLFFNLGFRSKRKGLMFGEWIDLALEDAGVSTSDPDEDDEGGGIPEWIVGIGKIIMVITIMIALFALGLWVF